VENWPQDLRHNDEARYERGIHRRFGNTTEKRREWVLKETLAEREERAKQIIRMLLAGPAINDILSDDPQRGFRALGDIRDINNIRKEFLQRSESSAVCDEIKEELTNVLQDKEAPERRAIEALASALLKGGDDGLNENEIIQIIEPFFRSA